MGQVTVNLNGHHYTIGCADGDEGRLKVLAEDIDKRMMSLVDAVGQVGDARLLVMLSLLLLDELEEARGAGAVPSGEDDATAEAIESLAARMESLAERMEAT
ncbi:MAG: cell division protein ZapA [Alphaproteobacteria bacterium]|nr:cell division protein ZapA [Alphaproteobacteria bacterium]